MILSKTKFMCFKSIIVDEVFRRRKKVYYKKHYNYLYSASSLMQFLANPAGFSREVDLDTLAFNIILLHKSIQFSFKTKQAIYCCVIVKESFIET